LFNLTSDLIFAKVHIDGFKKTYYNYIIPIFLNLNMKMMMEC